MTPAARVSAALEILADVETRRRPAPDALKDWGLAHRFAGSGDRAAISSLVHDTLRRKASSAWLLGEATPRACERTGACRPGQRTRTPMLSLSLARASARARARARRGRSCATWASCVMKDTGLEKL